MIHITDSIPLGRRALITTALFLSPVLGACGSDEPDAVAGPIDVTAIDYSFVDVPTKAQAGATLTLQNDSEKEVHEVVAIRLPDDEERSVEELVQLPPDQLAAFFPLVETVLVAPPGEAGFAVEGTGVLATPGRYALICVIPTGADPQEYLTAAAAAEGGPPDVAGGPPHIVEGMFAELVVE
ncbi:MAG: hypothetical protein HKN44_01365 [Ilumatobacter sp.]|nr:hypothetical protein [Ilumatobacter sp.]